MDHLGIIKGEPKKLTRLLYCEFLSYPLLYNKSFAQFPIARFMQITKMTLTKFLVNSYAKISNKHWGGEKKC